MTSLRDELRAFCIVHKLHMNTDLGQHFLVDEEILNAIVEAADLKESDTVVEIGPGIGVLTRELLQRASRVTAIELDKRLVPLLQTFTLNNPKLTVVQENALKVPMPAEPYKVVANIPYHITSPLLRHVFLESPQQPVSLTLLIQREVAEKICSPTDAGMLTILVALFGTPRLVTLVPPSAFLPPPKVDSAVLHIDCFDAPKANTETIERVFELTKIAFGQKRKMLSNTIGSIPGGSNAMDTLGIDQKRRPQTLSIEEWIALAEAVEKER